MKTPETQKPKVLDVAFIANCREGWCFALPSWRQAYSTPSNLARCAPPEAFLAVRASLAAFWLGITIWSMVEHKSNDWETAPEWYIYLTHWTLLFELFYLILATVVSGLAIASRNREPDGTTPCYVRLTYALQVLTYVAPFFVFVLFWALVYDWNSPDPPSVLSCFTHGVNFVVALCDFLIAGLPMRLNQMWVPVLYGITYVLFSLIYDLAGGTAGGEPYIYAVLDWSENAGVAAAYGGGVVFGAFPIVFLACLFCVYPLRNLCQCCPAAKGLDV